MSAFDEVYRSAASATGRSEAELRRMGEQVFASMLNSALGSPNETIWTVMRFCDGKINVEVNYPPRHAQKIAPVWLDETMKS